MTKIRLNELHLWFIEDQQIREPKLLEHYLGLLNTEEQTKQQRFYFEKDRHQYLITRSLLRTILSQYHHEIHPRDWQFVKNSHGKPYIANDITTPIFFNLSHTNGKIILVISSQDLVGVDIENIKRDSKIHELARNVFAAEESEYCNCLPLEDQQRYFFLLWTLKEAYIKAQGKGISLPMEDLVYQKGQIILKDKSDGWQFWSIESEDYQVSVAAKSADQPYEKLIMQKIQSAQDSQAVCYPVKTIPIKSID